MTAFQVSSTPLSDACASDALELGWSLAAGVYYLRELNALGLQPSEVMPLAEVCVSVGTDFLSAVSKLRAARMLWSHLLESLGMTDPSIRLHADCSPRSHSSICQQYVAHNDSVDIGYCGGR